jgi:multiple sugar transport system ATP-binding protein
MQVADPLTLYRSPENLFVAGFIGSPPMNLLKGKVRRKDGGLQFVENAEKDAVTVPLSGPVQPLAERYVDKDVVFGVRPEHLTDDVRNHPTSPLTSTVEIAEPMGAESLVYLKAGNGNFIARIPGETLYHIGQEVTVHINLEKVSLFDVDTENVIK